MIAIIQAILNQCNRHDRRYIFNKKHTRKLREHYHLSSAESAIYKLKGDDCATDIDYGLIS